MLHLKGAGESTRESLGCEEYWQGVLGPSKFTATPPTIQAVNETALENVEAAVAVYNETVPGCLINVEAFGCAEWP